METMGNRIGRLRRARNIKQEELAEQLGVTAQAVSKWENDASCPDISLLPQLAQLLGVTVDELLTGKGPEMAVRILPPEERKPLKDMMFRIVVDSHEGDKVRVNLPLALVQLAIEIGMEMPQVNGTQALKGIDLRQVLELVEQGVVGNLVEVESADGDFVRIFVE